MGQVGSPSQQKRFKSSHSTASVISSITVSTINSALISIKESVITEAALTSIELCVAAAALRGEALDALIRILVCLLVFERGREGRWLARCLKVFQLGSTEEAFVRLLYFPREKNEHTE